MTEDRRQSERRTNPRGGRRAGDPIVDLKTHAAKHITPYQAALYCEVSKQTVYKWLREGVLPKDNHFTREIRIKTDEFRMFVMRQLRRPA